MYDKGVFAVKLCAVSAGEANPILKAVMPFEKMLSPIFLCGKENTRLNTPWQYAGVRTEVTHNMLSVLF